ncbi:glutathione S-transferase family protein [Nordella sp. HKS 07]|uniref:glutathione S-transferase family protein n=1 Tax=Nordella sp. HKS 07 TaxID=2712222 RepID=UPI0013E11FE6|nr:glutathione S-transferase family protein [Nordella sp. HKS 07]QIG51261.1 glutathione S-transferase family protein [Nordella sp. HKS 07]
MIEVWGRRSSSNVQKVIWALDELGLEFKRHTVGGGFGGTHDPSYLKMNPNALVPVLRDGDITMFESNAIVRYLAARYGEGGLRPTAPRALAAAEQWMDWQQLNVVPHISAIFWNLVRVPADQRNDTAIAQANARLKEVLAIADATLGSSAWFAGDQFSFGDIVLGVLYWRYSRMDGERPDTPNIRRWFEALQQRPAYRKWVMVEVGNNIAEWNANEKALG